MNYLIVVAHPDDESDIGGTIYKLSQTGHDVSVCILCSKVNARRNLSCSLNSEEQKAMRILGVNTVFHADFPNIKMNTVPRVLLVSFIIDSVLKSCAKAIITHHPSDVNNDHCETSKATQEACAVLRETRNYAINRLMYMESTAATEWSLDSASNRFCPNVFVEIGEEGVQIKENAMKTYQGIVRSYPHPSSAISCRGLSAYRGAQAGCSFAEAFECVFRRN